MGGGAVAYNDFFGDISTSASVSNSASVINWKSMIYCELL